MTINQIVKFLNEKPGYLKEGKVRLAKILLKRGKRVAIEDCAKAIRIYNAVNTPRKFKRLFFDIETTPCKGWFWRPGYGINILPHQIIEYGKIICISYKWEGEDKVHNLRWTRDQDDKDMMIKFMEVMNMADESVAHNGDRFDEKWLRTRCLYHRIPAFPKYKTLDTLKKAKSGFNFPSNKLDEIGKFVGVGRKIYVSPDLWEKTWQYNDREALQKMVDYCDQDVLLLEDVFNVIKNYVYPNTHRGVHEGLPKWTCPQTGSKNVEYLKPIITKAGTVQRLMQSGDVQYIISDSDYMKFLQYK